MGQQRQLLRSGFFFVVRCESSSLTLLSLSRPLFFFFYLSIFILFFFPFFPPVVSLFVCLQFRNANPTTTNQPFSKHSGTMIIPVKRPGIGERRKHPSISLDHLLFLLLCRRRHHNNNRPRPLSRMNFSTALLEEEKRRRRVQMR